MEAELDDLTRRLGDALDTKTPLKWKSTKENPPTTPPLDNQNEDDFKLGTVNNPRKVMIFKLQAILIVICNRIAIKNLV